jgi:hypothetical protein
VGVNAQASGLPVLPAVGKTRSRLVRRLRALSLLCIAWMTVEAGVAIVAALLAGSVALIEAWAGEVCADCGPVGFDSPTVTTQGCDCE